MKTNAVVQPGSVISGTTRSEDLIPRFWAELHDINEDSRRVLGDSWSTSYRTYKAILDVIEARRWSRPYFESELGYYDLEALVNGLNELAPDGYYFGTHPGDGTDWGFWEIEE